MWVGKRKVTFSFVGVPKSCLFTEADRATYTLATKSERRKNTGNEST